MPIWSPTLSKPLPGTRPDPGKPLAARLQGFYTFNEAAGPAIYDAAQNLTLAATPGTVWQFASLPGLAIATTTDGAGATVPPALQFLPLLSIAFGFRPLANPSSSGTPLFGLYSTNSTNVRLLSFETNNPASIQMGFAGSNFGTSFLTTIGLDYVASATMTVNTGLNYVNGSLKYSAVTVNNVTWSATSRLTMGPAGTFFSGRNPNVLIYWAAWWNRALTAAEHTAIGAGVSAIFPLVFGTPRFYGLITPKVAVGGLVRRTLFDRTGSRGVA